MVLGQNSEGSKINIKHTENKKATSESSKHNYQTENLQTTFFLQCSSYRKRKRHYFLMYDSSFEIRTQNNIAENQKLKANKGLF